MRYDQYKSFHWNNDKTTMKDNFFLCGPQHLCPYQGRRDGIRLGTPVSPFLDIQNEAWSNQPYMKTKQDGDSLDIYMYFYRKIHKSVDILDMAVAQRFIKQKKQKPKEEK